MTQAQWLLLATKVVLVSNVVFIAAFVGNYTRLAPWWKDTLGRTIVIKDLLLVAAEAPIILSLFLSFSRLTSEVAAWTELCCLGLITPAMAWRIAVWQKEHRRSQPNREEPQ